MKIIAEKLTLNELKELAANMRNKIIEIVAKRIQR